MKFINDSIGITYYLESLWGKSMVRPTWDTCFPNGYQIIISYEKH